MEAPSLKTTTTIIYADQTSEILVTDRGESPLDLTGNWLTIRRSTGRTTIVPSYRIHTIDVVDIADDTSPAR